jgi:hypothetical protein
MSAEHLGRHKPLSATLNKNSIEWINGIACPESIDKRQNSKVNASATGCARFELHLWVCLIQSAEQFIGSKCLLMGV